MRRHIRAGAAAFVLLAAWTGVSGEGGGGLRGAARGAPVSVTDIQAVFGPTASLDSRSHEQTPELDHYPGEQRRASARNSPLARLTRELDSRIDDPRLQQATITAHVRSLRTGETVYARHPMRLMVPASSQKVLTAIAAAKRLGWEYRFTTRLLATGPIREDGTLDGDLVVWSNGDPSINTRHPERWRVFDEWAKTLRAGGVRYISGRIVGDDSSVDEPAWGDGWAWDDLQFGYGSEVGALQFNENQVEVLVSGGFAAGDAAVVNIAPSGSGLAIVNKLFTVSADAVPQLRMARVPGRAQLVLEGTIALKAPRLALSVAVANPTWFYLRALREALAPHGIFARGEFVDIDELALPPKLATATVLAEDRSAPLQDIIDVMLKWSRNNYAESLLLALAQGEPARASAGLEAMGAAFRELGIDERHYLPRDGSGLSRNDTLSAELLTFLLARMWADEPNRDTWLSTLPVAGESGTLATRMKNGPARGRVWAKTGSMSNVRTLTGYLLTADDEAMSFAILANNYLLPSSAVEDAIDGMVEQLAAFKR